MLSSLFLKRDPSYAPIHEQNEEIIHYIYHSEEDTAGSDTTLKDLLGEAHRNDSALCIFQTTAYGSFSLWTTRSRTPAATTSTCEDVFTTFRNFIQDKRSRQKQTCALYNLQSVDQTKIQAFDGSHYPVLAILARYDNELLKSFGIPSAQQAEIALLHRIEVDSRPKRMWARSLSVVASCILGVLTCLLVATFILRRDTPKEISDKFHTWIQYKTEGSSGPKYQLAINGKNASQWNAYVNDDTRQWALRVDDQAIIPLELMDEEEKHYQEWFHKRYPEVRKITLDRDYLNETWLNSPSRDLVPVDEMFHFSHCVLALRRYVKAKRTGRHVCGRDLDEEHMNHCLDSFDWWAFREGERGDSLENPKQPLWWRTKVCFD